MNLYDLLFSQFGTSIGQVLLTRNDIHERSKYLNACNTFNELLSMGIVPIVNENDTVSVAEIRFGDNDTLSAVTANMVKADILILLTDVECMYTDNPRTNPEAKAVYVVDNVFSDSLQQVNTQSGGSSLGTGGMVTKIVAAKLATSAGIEVVISSGKAPNKIPEIIRRVFSGESPSDDFKYTHFKALKEAIRGSSLF
jgi:glutamate 5-kinase